MAGERALPGDGVARWLRSAWVRLPVLAVGFGVVFLLADLIVDALRGTGLLCLAVGLVLAGAALLAYRLLVRWVERRPVVELARAGAVAAVGRGMLLGSALFVVVIGLIAAFGGYRVTGFGSVFGLIAVMGIMAVGAVVEEVLFRGILFRLVEELAGTWGALIVSGLLFGVLHLVNPAATVWGALAIAIEAGLMLGAAYAATRRLWVPIAIHFGWNVALSGIFGAVVSGADGEPVGLLRAAMRGPAVLTGGGFGPEASIVSILVCSAATVLFLRSARRRGLIYPRRRAAAGQPAAVAAL